MHKMMVCVWFGLIMLIADTQGLDRGMSFYRVSTMSHQYSMVISPYKGI